MICRIVSLYQDNQAEEARDGGHRRGFMGFVLKMCQRIIDSKIDISLYTDSEIVEQWNELIATQVQPLLVIAAKPLVSFLQSLLLFETHLMLMFTGRTSAPGVS